MDCLELQGYIFDRILGEDLPGSVAEKLEEHLAGCRSCREKLQEASAAWDSLSALKKVNFPRSLSRRTMALVGDRPRSLRLLGRPLHSGRLILVAASLIISVGLWLLFSPSPPSGPEPLRSASTFSRSPISGPDLTVTLNGYLEESGEILSGIENGKYSTWGDLLAEIIARDMQGRSNFLLEKPELDFSARSVVEGLHQAFWTLLQKGRDRGDRAFEIPPEVNLNLWRGEIARYQVVPHEKRD